MKLHYVYRLTCIRKIKGFEDKLYYVGKHSGSLDDFKSGKYKTSSKIVKKLFDVDTFNVKIVRVYDNPIAALRFEAKYHERVNAKDNNIFFNNQNQKLSHKLDRTDQVTVKDLLTGDVYTVTLSEFYNNDNLIATNTNEVLCRNKITGESARVSKLEFERNDDLVGINHEIMHCVDKLTGKKITINKAEYDPEKHYHSFSNISVFDTLTLTKTSVSKWLFNNSNGRYVGIKKITKEGKKHCDICNKDISLSNYERHAKRHNKRLVWITDISNTNSYKVTESEYYQKYKNTHYEIEKDRDSTYGYINGERHNIRYVGRINKNLKPGETNEI